MVALRTLASYRQRVYGTHAGLFRTWSGIVLRDPAPEGENLPGTYQRPGEPSRCDAVAAVPAEFDHVSEVGR